MVRIQSIAPYLLIPKIKSRKQIACGFFHVPYSSSYFLISSISASMS